MKKMAALRAFLESTHCFRNEQFDAWVEELEQTTRGRFDGNSVLLYTMEYRAVFSIERFAYTKYPIEVLHTRLITWLADNDDRNAMKEPEPKVVFDVLDNSTADVEITLMFEEDVYISPSEQGNIEYNGQKWALVHSAHDVAESFDLMGVNE
ncbi:phage tail protein [Marinomonas posidonica]|uniref:phage tail protein n=1 Tax=Marinomonas posidonica TaxID=936476 RepID=UPI0037370E12